MAKATVKLSVELTIAQAKQLYFHLPTEDCSLLSAPDNGNDKAAFMRAGSKLCDALLGAIVEAQRS